MYTRLIIVILIAAPLAFWSLAGAKPSATTSAAGSWQIDPAHSGVVFKIAHLDISYVYGRFNKIDGSFDNGDHPSFAFTVPARSIDTNNAKRDGHLKSPDFFNVKQFPIISFKSTAVTPSETGYQITGDLMLHGVTRSITLDLHVSDETEFPKGTKRVGLFCEFTINRSDFAMDNMIGPVGEEVTLMVSLEGISR
jgi:polyisoprenoid-binding protein YceI